MKTLGNKSIIIALLTFMFLLLFACSNQTTPETTDDVGNNTNTEATDDTEATNDQEDNQEEVEKKEFSNEAVTLKVATPWGEEYFMNRIGNYVEEKLGHITLEHVDWDGSVENMEESYAKDIVPDVLLAFTGQQPLEELDMVFPLEEMVESYGVDLSQIQPVLIDEIRSRDKEGRLVGIPQEMGRLGLYYNKDVFDLFGVPYPEPDESMSWKKVLELARKMTGQRNGSNYCGLEFGANLYTAPLLELSPSMTDAETGEVLLTKDEKFTKYMNLMNDYYSIPGISEINKEDSCSLWHLHQR